MYQGYAFCSYCIVAFVQYLYRSFCTIVYCKGITASKNAASESLLVILGVVQA